MIKVLAARQSDLGEEKIVDLIVMMICSGEGNQASAGQLDEQVVLQRQLMFTDTFICFQQPSGRVEDAAAPDDAIANEKASGAPRHLLLKALRLIIEQKAWPRCKLLLRSVLMLNSKYHQECFPECLSLVKVLVSTTTSFEQII